MIKTVIIACLTIALVGAAYVWASSPAYTLSPVATIEEVIACQKANGKAAMVADLAPDGSLTSEWAPSCLTPVP